MSAVDDYIEAIVRRSREPMEPRGYAPDWADQPRRHKYYPGALHHRLPYGGSLPGTLEEGLDPERAQRARGRWTTEALSALLLDSYGLTGRRLAVHGNPDLKGMPWYPTATWSRGVSSGGGLYPLEFYWVAGPGGPLTPGIYNYSSPHHSMQRILTGDATGRVHEALRGDVPYTGQYMLLSVKFWKNSFKYNSFVYHAVTMDVGTLLGAWTAGSRAAGLELRPRLWFDEPDLDRLLGLDARDESVMAVVPLPWAGDGGAEAPAASCGAASVGSTESERSRNTVRFPQVARVHEEILADTATEPAAERFGAARTVPPAVTGPEGRSGGAGQPEQAEQGGQGEQPAVPAAPEQAGGAGAPARAERPVHRLPAPRPLDVPVAKTLRERRSSFGRFSSTPQMTQEDLSTLLQASVRSADLLGVDGTSRLGVFVNHVQGLAPGSYDHLPEQRALRPVREAALAEFLQSAYFLSNYNLEQCSAVIGVLARPTAVTSELGPRGYRVLNAEVGAVCQNLYMACAALGLGCGAALGFDNVAHREELAVEDPGEWPLLMLMVGEERQGQPEFVYRNV